MSGDEAAGGGDEEHLLGESHAFENEGPNAAAAICAGGTAASVAGLDAGIGASDHGYDCCLVHQDTAALASDEDRHAMRHAMLHAMRHTHRCVGV